jgi:hypothetical protein
MKPNDGDNSYWAWNKVNTAENYHKIIHHNNKYEITVRRVPQDKYINIDIFVNCNWVNTR